VEVVAELPKTPSNKVQKYRLRETGVGGATWDRVEAGYRLREEIKRAEARRARSAPTGEGD
jgi:crotonobetaine/carnitine-CoA ligase